MHGGTASHGNGEHGPRVGSASFFFGHGHVDTVKQVKPVSKVSTGTCEMLRGGLFPLTTNISPRSPQKKQGKSKDKESTAAQSKDASRGNSSQLLCSPTLWQA